MAVHTLLVDVVPAIPVRDQFAAAKAAYLVAIHMAMIATLWHTNWSAIGVCLLLHALCGGLGICVGNHRLLTHRSFKCPKAVEYVLALLGVLCVEGGPIDWVAHHRQHHQYADDPEDPHSARQGFWWSHVMWMMWTPNRGAWQELKERYVPDLLRVPFYRFRGNIYVWLSLLLAAGLYLVGGWPFVVWGMVVRLVLTYHSTFLVNSATHTFGYRNFHLNDLSTNCWWVTLLSYGEGWHNNHHAFPTSARPGPQRLQPGLFPLIPVQDSLDWPQCRPLPRSLPIISPSSAQERGMPPVNHITNNEM